MLYFCHARVVASKEVVKLTVWKFPSEIVTVTFWVFPDYRIGGLKISGCPFSNTMLLLTVPLILKLATRSPQYRD